MWPADPSADVDAVAARARRLGPLPYSALRRSRGHPAPQPGAEVVAAVVAKYLDRWWEELGGPDPFVVVEEGAGDGRLAAAVIEASPSCRTALRYVLVEADPERRRGQSSRLRLEPPALALGPVLVPSGADGESDAYDELRPAPGRGPLVTSLGEAPAMAVEVVLSVGWLSSLPSDVRERRGDGWVEIRLAAAPGGGLAEISVPAAAEPPDVEVDEGWRVPIQRAASEWCREVLQRMERGRVAIIDRVVRSTAELAVAPGAPRPAPAVALDQLEGHRRARITDLPALSPFLLCVWDVGSPDG